jgi:competence protein ComEC
VRFALDPGERALCIPRAIWIAHLHTGGSLCGTYSGKWKAYSLPRNLPDDPPKRVVYEFRASRLQAAGSESSWERGLRRIEVARERVSALFREHDPLGLLHRLLLDESTPGSPDGLLRILGNVHLLSATGIHLYALERAIEAALVMGGQALGGSDRLVLGTARGVAGFAWLLAWAFCGFRRGMLRPILLITCRAAGRSLGLRWRMAAPLIVALALDAWLLGTGSARGRMLYAAAVAGGVLGGELARKGRHAGLVATLREHAGMAIGSYLPAALLDGVARGWLALGTPLVSCITIPWIASVVYPGAAVASALELLGARHLAGALASALGASASGLAFGLSRASLALPLFWVVPRVAIAMAAGFAGLLFFARAWKPRLGVLGVAILLRLALSTEGPPGGEARRVDQLDVGQGDAALVLGQEGGAGLIDVGPGRALAPDRWIELFSSRGVSRIEWVALTHLDEDHVGALKKLAGLLPIACVAASPRVWASDRGCALSAFLRSRGIRTSVLPGRDCFPYQSFALSAEKEPAASSGNSQMGAYLVPVSGQYYLNLGDADSSMELQALPGIESAIASAPRALVLKISHHGSRFSSSAAFLRALHPERAWISVGVGNRYGHPTEAVLARLRALGLCPERTDERGAISSEESPECGPDQSRRRPPSTTRTSPVTHEASGLKKNLIAPATSAGSPIRPSGKAAPRRA